MFYINCFFIFQRREWLEKALDNATVSPVSEMKRAIEIIQKNESETDDRVAALETLIEWCEHIDFAIGMLFCPRHFVLSMNPVITE